MKLNYIQTAGKLSIFINANWWKTGPERSIWLKRRVFLAIAIEVLFYK